MTPYSSKYTGEKTGKMHLYALCRAAAKIEFTVTSCLYSLLDSTSNNQVLTVYWIARRPLMLAIRVRFPDETFSKE